MTVGCSSKRAGTEFAKGDDPPPAGPAPGVDPDGVVGLPSDEDVTTSNSSRRVRNYLQAVESPPVPLQKTRCAAAKAPMVWRKIPGASSKNHFSIIWQSTKISFPLSLQPNGVTCHSYASSSPVFRVIPAQAGMQYFVSFLRKQEFRPPRVSFLRKQQSSIPCHSCASRNPGPPGCHSCASSSPVLSNDFRLPDPRLSDSDTI